MKIRVRILLGFISVIGIMMIVDCSALYDNIKIIRQVDKLELSKRTELIESYRIAYFLQRMKSNIRELLLEGRSPVRPEEIKRAQEILNEMIPKIEASLAELNRATQLDFDLEVGEEKERESDELALLETINKQLPAFYAATTTIIELQMSGAYEEAEMHFEEEAEPISREVQQLIFKLVQNAEGEVKWAIQQLYAHMESAIRLGIYLTILSLCLAMAIGLYISKSISNPLLKLVKGADEFGRGHLDTTVQIDTKGELQLLAKSFNQMAFELKHKIESINSANEQLNEANQTKDTFFSIIAHDLKNPFNAILGYTYLLSEHYDEYDEAERKQFIADIGYSSRITYELLENLLNWARTQSGKIEINNEHLNLYDLIQRCLESHTSNAQSKEITLENMVPESLMAHLDLNTMRVVFNNLISNAVKFTPNGGHISISGKQSETEIQIKVKDTGVGMSDEVIRKLLLLDGTHSTPGTGNENGTGLGLILVKEFLRRNGGELDIHSEPGKGTEFLLRIPAS